MSELKEINIILGKNIRSIREKNNITREHLAEQINVSPRFLADVESGKVGVSLTTLKKTCIILNVSADYLLGITDYNEKDMYIASIESKINKMNTITLKNLDNIINCIINIQNF